MGRATPFVNKDNMASEGGLSVENTNESVESLTREAETLKVKLEEERQKLNDVARKLRFTSFYHRYILTIKSWFFDSCMRHCELRCTTVNFLDICFFNTDNIATISIFFFIRNLIEKNLL